MGVCTYCAFRGWVFVLTVMAFRGWVCVLTSPGASRDLYRMSRTKGLTIQNI